jgi:hypothetical protein
MIERISEAVIDAAVVPRTPRLTVRVEVAALAAVSERTSMISPVACSRR